MRDSSVLDIILDELARRDLPPSTLTIEITEEQILTDRAVVSETLGRLRSEGVNMSIDDFGTGYSSFTYLRELPVNEIKIDKSFVQPMTRDDGALALVEATIRLGHDLGLGLVAGGVEDAATAQILTELGCDQIQGYYVSRPLPPTDLDAWLGDVRVVARAGEEM
jgi:diguanylate cyclase